MLKKLLVAAVVLIIVVAGGLYLIKDDAAKLVRIEIEAQGSRALGAAVRVREAAILGEGAEATLKLAGVTIANPTGVEGDPAIAMREVWIRFEARATRPTDRFLVREIIADGVTVRFVGDTNSNNLEQLHRNAIAAARRRGPDGPRLQIDLFNTRSGELRITHRALSEPITGVLPPVGTSSIGRRENAATAAEATQRLLGAIVAEATRSVASEVQAALARRPR